MKHQGYYTRALRANDPRYARIFGRLGYGRSDLAADDAVESKAEDRGEQGKDQERLAALRDEYQSVVGKRPYHGWDEATLAEKIAAARSAG